MMQYYFKGSLIILIIFVLSISSKSAEASVEFLNPYYSCEKKFYELTIKENEADDEMLIKAKVSYKQKQYEDAIQYADQVIKKHEGEAKVTLDSLEECPWMSNEDIFKHKSVNTMGLALLIKAKSYAALGDHQEEKEIYGKIWNEYYCAACWCEKGLFLKPARIVEDELFLGKWVLSQSENRRATLEAYKDFQVIFLPNWQLRVKRKINGKIKVKKGGYQVDNKGRIEFLDVLDNKEIAVKFTNGNLIFYWNDPPLVLERE